MHVRRRQNPLFRAIMADNPEKKSDHSEHSVWDVNMWRRSSKCRVGLEIESGWREELEDQSSDGMVLVANNSKKNKTIFNQVLDIYGKKK